MNPASSSALRLLRFSDPIGAAIGFSLRIEVAVLFTLEHSSSFRRMILNVEFQTVAETSSLNVMEEDIKIRLTNAKQL